MTFTKDTEFAEPIRVVHAVGKVVAGGVEAVVMNYYRNIDRSKIQFDFIMDGYQKTLIDEEIKRMGGLVYKVEPYEKNLFKNLYQCYKIFKQNRYNVFHCHMNSLSVLWLFAALIARVPVRISHSHSTSAKGEGKKTLFKNFLRPFSRLFPTHYCACSAYAGNWLFGSGFYNKGKVKLVKNAINIKRFSFNHEIREKLRKAFDLENKFVIGHVGRFVYQKNHEFLIGIFNEIHKRNADAVLMLIGTGELEGLVRQRVNEAGLDNNVLFLGTRQDVNDLMQAMDVFLLPSFYEGLPVVGVEAQTAGLPCVLSDAMTKETRITSSTKFLSLTKSAGEWAEEILSYVNEYKRLKTDEDIRKAGFDIEYAAQDLAELYREILCN